MTVLYYCSIFVNVDHIAYSRFTLKAMLMSIQYVISGAFLTVVIQSYLLSLTYMCILKEPITGGVPMTFVCYKSLPWMCTLTLFDLRKPAAKRWVCIPPFCWMIAGQGRKEGRLYGVGHNVNDHSDSERGNPLPPHGLLFPVNSKGSFICTIPQTG